jgi:hypothetical protein
MTQDIFLVQLQRILSYLCVPVRDGDNSLLDRAEDSTENESRENHASSHEEETTRLWKAG